jgi:hypothetical protein
MAVKVVDVWFVTTSPCGTAEVFEKCPPPCKLGDGTELAKVTADALLSKPMYDQVITDAELVKLSAEKKPSSDHQFYCEITDKVRMTRDPETDGKVEL